MVVKEYESPFGLLYLASIGSELCLCSWNGLADAHDMVRATVPDSDFRKEWDVVEEARRELEEYFGGTRETFDVPLKISGTEFQRLVWQALMSIPYGKTESFGSLARTIGRPSAVTAVANACEKNPLAIFIPAHRVLPRRDSLSARPEKVELKLKLIAMERKDSAD